MTTSAHPSPLNWMEPLLSHGGGSSSAHKNPSQKGVSPNSRAVRSTNKEAAALPKNQASSAGYVLELSQQAMQILMQSRSRDSNSARPEQAENPQAASLETRGLFQQFEMSFEQVVQRSGANGEQSFSARRIEISMTVSRATRELSVNSGADAANSFLRAGTDALETLEGRGLKILFESLKKFAENAARMAKTDGPQAKNFMSLMESMAGAMPEVFSFVNDAMSEIVGNGSKNFSMVLEANFQSIAAVANAGGSEAVEAANAQLQAMGVSVRIEISSGSQEGQSDPIVLDLDGDGFELTSAEEGVEFDITGDGQKEKSATVTGGDAFLAMDRNGNNRIDSGKELFGDQHGAKNGFEELRKYDENKDDRIDVRDSIFGKLRLFSDNNKDGIGMGSELKTLTGAGISSINLNYVNVRAKGAGGNVKTQQASFTRQNGSTGSVADFLVNYLA